jgi:hypothetical protein
MDGWQVLIGADRFVSKRDVVGEDCAAQCNGLLDACEAFFCANAQGLVMSESFLHLPPHILVRARPSSSSLFPELLTVYLIC